MFFRAAVSPISTIFQQNSLIKRNSRAQSNRRFLLVTAIFAMFFGMLLSVSSASAQTASHATIPFAFSANGRAFPPGHYRMTLRAENYLTLASEETGDVAGVLVRTTRSQQPITQGTLTFERTSGAYRLSGIQFANANLQSELSVRSKLERELASAKKENTEIAMR